MSTINYFSDPHLNYHSVKKLYPITNKLHRINFTKNNIESIITNKCGHFIL